MRKYLTVFAIDWQNQFIYRLNFVLWRFRNVLRVLMTYYLWNTIFSSRLTAFGYARDQMMTYIFLSLFVSSLIHSAPSNDHMGGEISSGDLSNFLVKPLHYLKYWFIRDLSSKLLNLLFAGGEIALLWLIFNPSFTASSSGYSVPVFVFFLILGILLYFLISKLAIFVSFWTPENTWGLMFFILVCLEMLSGLIFPLDLLPSWAYIALQFTPFPYLLYFPIAALLGKLSPAETIRVSAQFIAWILVSYFLVKRVWNAGLKAYSAVGR